ncbi:hypothetical protein [Thermotalea metallivorans]|uniref:Uncharacterized protein n=1 Tax=Thermotalea metallivorans TaxID=520762 RepID=A0A140L6Y6_9FIRM|nr:hypothetical protein [Thermotalea metallivorans]KXG76311.1 hypothetical protein AN619_12680 [Thermotalea metallivorans]
MELKKRHHERMILVLTLITVLGIWNMSPTKGGFLPAWDTGSPSDGGLETRPFVGISMNLYSDDILHPDQEGPRHEMVLDDRTLERFIYIYHHKIKGNAGEIRLPVEIKEEIRYVLENMGTINTTRLKEVLQQEAHGETIRQVKAILEENLFDRELQYLDELILQK